LEHIISHGTKSANLPFSDAVCVGEVLYLSGQLGNIPGTRNIVPGGIEAETRQMMENIARVLNARGLSFDNLNQLPNYPPTLGLKLSVQPGAKGMRPLATLEAADHPLAIEQREGIALAKVLEFVGPWLHP
jgi:Endoribonuclease L-PSP/Uncharacterized protein conserved in bacteria (DUF2199)